jgi:peptide/nickel transport system ATP-binding protein
MYAGSIVESGPAERIFAHPSHPYTRALLACEVDPWSAADTETPLTTIPGIVPDLVTPPAGCIFQARCQFASAQCDRVPPARQVAPSHLAKCWLS